MLFLSAGFSIAVLVSCGGGGADVQNPAPVPVSPPASAQAPGGLYVGYYYEDPVDNPEDTTLGTVFLNLPDGNSDFKGNMSFSYVGCQTENVGTVAGLKTDKTLTGSWTGTLDAIAEGGSYKGVYESTQNSYSGTYTVTGGKKFREVPNCIRYYIAAYGTWQLFPLNSTSSGDDPAAQGIAISGTNVTWFPPSGTTNSLVSLIDQERALRNENQAVIVQSFTTGNTFDLPATLVAGRSYVASVVSRNAVNQTYVSNKVFVK